ncbi:MAG: rhomboid family intramembrane serine protease [Thermoleophilia bacterium]|nr:rhomboid family intramembrane serine protease [Thermoleophilia bacterium]
MLSDDPLRAAATDNGLVDGWQGARLRHRAELDLRVSHRDAVRRMGAEIDLGEPGLPRVVGCFLLVSVLATVLEFAHLGTTPTARELADSGGVYAGALATGDWWAVITANLLHGSISHVAINAFIIYLAGRWAERLAGRGLMVAVIAWSIVGTSVGALLLDPRVVSVGASGVAFGILGCALVIDPKARTLAGTIARTFAIINIITTFLVPGISVGGHLGGLAAGALVALVGWSRTPSDGHPLGAPRRLAMPVAAGLGAALLAALALFDVMLPDTAARWGEVAALWFVSH